MTPVEDELNRPRDRSRRVGRDSGSARRTHPRAERSRSGQPETELARAREILRRVPELPTHRLEEIKDRIRGGYYHRADVLDTIARRLADDL